MTATSVALTIFLVDDDPGVAASAIARVAGGRLERRDVRVGGGVPRPAGPESGRVPRARRDDAGPRRARAATTARRCGRIVADRVHQRSRRHPDVGAGHQGGRDGFPDQAGRGRRRLSRQCAPRSSSTLRRGATLADAAELRQRFASLTPRERDVLAELAAGKLNKQIAADLGVVEQTVKFHRARIMDRMQAKTAAELMHIAGRLGHRRRGGASNATPHSAAKPTHRQTREAASGLGPDIAGH